MSTRTLVAAAVVVTILSPLAAGDAFAQDRVAPATGTQVQAVEFLTLPSETAAAAAEPQAAPLSSPQTAMPIQQQKLSPSRPGSSGGMMALYVSTAAMQALDIHSTLAGLHGGAAEANPLMGGVTKSPSGMIAVKAAETAGTIFAAQKLAKRNKPAAIAMLVAINSAYAMIAVHNYRVAGNLK